MAIGDKYFLYTVTQSTPKNMFSGEMCFSLKVYTHLKSWIEVGLAVDVFCCEPISADVRRISDVFWDVQTWIAG